MRPWTPIKPVPYRPPVIYLGTTWSAKDWLLAPYGYVYKWIATAGRYGYVKLSTLGMRGPGG